MYGDKTVMLQPYQAKNVDTEGEGEEFKKLLYGVAHNPSYEKAVTDIEAVFFQNFLYVFPTGLGSVFHISTILEEKLSLYTPCCQS